MKEPKWQTKAKIVIDGMDNDDLFAYLLEMQIEVGDDEMQSGRQHHFRLCFEAGYAEEVLRKRLLDIKFLSRPARNV